MSKLFSRIAGLFSSKTFAGVDKAGNKYFTRKHDIDGNLKEKRWVIFKGEEDPTSVPVEWICWLNGQRKIAPTPEEMAELEARRERVKLNVALLKKEEEEKKAKVGSSRQRMRTGKVGGPDLKSFIQQYPTASSKGDGQEEGVVDGSTGRYRWVHSHAVTSLSLVKLKLLVELYTNRGRETYYGVSRVLGTNRIWSILQTRDMAATSMIERLLYSALRWLTLGCSSWYH